MNRSLIAALMFIALTPAPALSAARQDHVRAKSEMVMPFSLEQTVHHFVPDKFGGVMTVLTRKTNPQQVRLIRAHLAAEASAFASGHYNDPARIHGGSMPGLSALEKGATRVSVRYAEVGSGARISFRSQDPALILAIHQWFAAQVSDHGADATPM